MRVHQPGGHLMRGGRPTVEDWSWPQTKRRLHALYRLARPYRARTLIAIVSLLAATAVSLVPPYLVGRAVDEVRRGDTHLLVLIVIAFVAAGVLGVVFSYAQTYFTGWTGERMLADLRNNLFRHLQRLSLGFYERNRAGVIISRLTNDVEALDQLVTDGVSSLIQNTLTLVGTAVLLFFLDWRLALATMGVMPLMAVATAWFRKRSGRAYRSVRETLGLVTATLAEDIAGMRVLQSFTREDAAQQNFRQIGDDYRVANMRTVVLSGLYFPFVDFLSTAATAVVLGYGGWLAYHGEVSIGIVVAFLGYLTNFFDPVQQLSQLYNTFLSAVAALDKITDVLDEAPEVEDAPGAFELDEIAGHVAFEVVRFAYGRGPEVLHGIDLDVAAGTTVALVGHTGRRQVDDRQVARTLLRPDRAAASRSTAPTFVPSRSSRCADSSGSCRRRASSSPAPWPRTSRSDDPTRRTRRSWRRRGPSAPTNSSTGSSRVSRRSSASAARDSHSVSDS